MLFMNGEIAPNHLPCNPDTEESPCCLTDVVSLQNKTADGCLDTGLCFADDGLIYEGSCTDPNWHDPCPHLCPDSSTKFENTSAIPDWKLGQRVTYWEIIVCSSNTICCRAANGLYDYCSDTANQITSATLGMTLATKVAAANGTTSTSIGTSPANKTSAAAATHTQCSQPHTATVGTAVGAPLGVALLAALAALAFPLHKQRQPKRQLLSTIAELPTMLKLSYTSSLPHPEPQIC